MKEIPKMTKPIKLAVSFSERELEQLSSSPSTEQAKKMLWLYIKMPEFIHQLVPFHPLDLNTQGDKTLYMQFSRPEEQKALALFSGKRSYFIKHLLLSETKVFEALTTCLLGGEYRNVQPQRLLNDEQNAILTKLDRIETLVLSEKQERLSMLKKERKPEALVSEKQNHKAPHNEESPFSKEVEDEHMERMKKNRIHLPPIGAGSVR